VLARDLDACREQVCERRYRDELAGDPGATSPVRRDGAAHHQTVVVRLEAALRELRLELGKRIGPEDGFDAGLASALANPLRGAPRSHQERQRAEHDRFPGAGLAGQHVEAAVELELRTLDDREALDAQRLDHRSPQRSFSRSTSK
jgi:hypothetical protein